MADKSIDISIGDRDGMVFMSFHEPQRIVVMEPENARQIGEALAKAGYEAAYGKKPIEGRSVISEQIHQRLVTRVLHVMRSMAEQKKAVALIATNVVDVVLAEVR